MLGSTLKNQQKTSLEKLIVIGINEEGHPDNIAPTMIGGCVISVLNNKEWGFSKVSIAKDLNVIIYIPEMEFETKKSRSLLNPLIDRKNAVFNIVRVGLLINSLNNKEYSLLKFLADLEGMTFLYLHCFVAFSSQICHLTIWIVCLVRIKADCDIYSPL